MGTPGSATYEVNAFGRRVKKLVKDRWNNGSSNKTLYDKDIQIYAYQQLKRKSGICGCDGYVWKSFVLRSSPSYDPNKFTYGIVNERLQCIKSR